MRAALVTLAAAFALLGASSASGSAQLRSPLLGVLPHTGAPAAMPPGLHALSALSGYGPLVYHGGPVMHTSTTYAIYWIPTGSTACGGAACQVDPQYEPLINQYFTDVAAASAGSSDDGSNVYSVATQYSDAAGAVRYESTFGGFYRDPLSFPTSGGCDDHVDAVCLTDDQLQTEIQDVIAAEGWPAGGTSLFFVMLPKFVGVCRDGSGSSCTTNAFCAYHSAFGQVSHPIIYAVEPYEATILNSQGKNACWDGTSPNGDDADATINTISHEQNEAITDPLGDAWWSEDGEYDENADLCAWTFGTPLGGAGASAYNQVINNDHYWLQQEYSNAGASCVQSAEQLPPGNMTSPAVSGTAAEGQQLASSTGAWAFSPTAYAYQWQRCSSLGAGCVDVPGATNSTYTLTSADGGATVRSTVSAQNANGSSAYTASATSGVVVPLPASTALPMVSGVAAVGKMLSTTSGTWNTPSTFAYQWLRCDPSGGGCTSVAGASGPTYLLVGADAGYTLEASVSATDTAGTVAALSAQTAVVISRPAPLRMPHILGRARTGRTLRANAGAWSSSPSAFGYQWLRCNASGSRCVAIRGATRSSYRVVRRDVRHRLRVRITAANGAGPTAVTSAASARIR